MSLFDYLGTLAKAKETIDAAEKIRAEKVAMALGRLVAESRMVTGDDLPDVLARNLPLVLKASSQGSAVREIAKSLGLGDAVKGLVDKLEGR